MNQSPKFKIPETIKEDTKKYQNEVDRFLAGELDNVRFKGHRVPMGVYGQRSEAEKEEYMIRVRAPGGVITKQQLKKLNQLAKQYGKSYLHFTTRQDIQIHGVDIEDTPEILFELLEVGLSPRGGGGNTVRNIVCSSRAGVHPDEDFDPTPYSLALTEYLIRSRSSFNLPRKYKIAFSSTEKDEALATVNDLGFIAKKKNGQKGFKVYAAGGMGNSSKIALLLEEFVSADQIFNIAEAIKRLFDDYGDRSNKHQARLRFVRKRLGDEGFKNKYKEYLNEVREEGIKTEEIHQYQMPRKDLDTSNLNLELDYIHLEKKPGYYSLDLRPENGDISFAEMRELLSLLEKIDTDEISLRTTNRQGIIIRGVKEDHIDYTIERIKAIDFKLLTPYISRTPIACKGASTCRLGLCLSPNLSKEISKKLSSLAVEKQKELPQIYISGCPNACGQHLIAKIGFEGKAKRYDGKLVPHYTLLLGGQTIEDNARYAERLIDIPAKRIPEFLAELAGMLAEDESYKREEFNQYLADGGQEKIVELADEFTAIADYDQEPSLYKDWGSEKDFSLAGRGPGECGVGVMDIMQLDLDTAKENFKAAKDEDNQDRLYQAIIDAARALLTVKGVDSEKDRVIIREFKDKFIQQRLVDDSHNKTLDLALDYKLGDLDNLLDYLTEVESLIQRVDKLFNSLNAKLEFDLEDKEINSKEQTDNEAEKSEVADLRGVKCPMNFVKAKVAIAPLEPGQEIEIYLDEGEPIANVPDSLTSEGHQILEKKKLDKGYYILRVKKAE